MFKTVSTEPRRQIVLSLLDAPADGTVSLPESAVNPEVSVDAEALRIDLFHRHLPMLADAGFVEWEAEPLVAARGPRFEEVATVFDALHRCADGIPDSLVVGCRGLEQARDGES